MPLGYTPPLDDELDAGAPMPLGLPPGGPPTADMDVGPITYSQPPPLPPPPPPREPVVLPEQQIVTSVPNAPQAPARPSEASRLTSGGQNLIDSAYAGKASSINSLADAQSQKAREEADIAKRSADEQRKLVEDSERIRRESDAAIENRLRALDAHSAEVAQQKIDPNRFWNSKSGGEQALGIIGILLSGVGNGLSRNSEGGAMAMLDKMMTADMRAQEANIANARAGVESERGSLASFIRLAGDQDAGRAAYRANKLAGFAQQLQEVAARYKTPEIQANAQAALADLNKLRGDEMKSAGEKLRAREGAAASAKMAQEKADREYALKLAELGIKAQETGAKRSEKTDEGARNLSRDMQQAGVPQVLASLGSVFSLVDMNGKGDIPGVGMFDGRLPNWMAGEQGRRVRQAVQQAYNGYFKQNAGGAVSDAEDARMRLALGAGATEAEFRDGVLAMSQAASRIQKNVRAGYSPEVQSVYDARNGGTAYVPGVANGPPPQTARRPGESR